MDTVCSFRAAAVLFVAAFVILFAAPATPITPVTPVSPLTVVPKTCKFTILLTITATRVHSAKMTRPGPATVHVNAPTILRETLAIGKRQLLLDFIMSVK